MLFKLVQLAVQPVSVMVVVLPDVHLVCISILGIAHVSLHAQLDIMEQAE